MKTINISTNKYPNTYTFVDDKDFQWLNQWKWYYCNGYAMRNREKSRGLVRMHRMINNTPLNLFTDHINRDKLDNRRENLRTVVKSLNEHNTGVRKNSKSKVKGIIWDQGRNRWRAEIMINRVKRFVGRFRDLESAILARRKYEI